MIVTKNEINDRFIIKNNGKQENNKTLLPKTSNTSSGRYLIKDNKAPGKHEFVLCFEMDNSHFVFNLTIILISMLAHAAPDNLTVSLDIMTIRLAED